MARTAHAPVGARLFRCPACDKYGDVWRAEYIDGGEGYCEYYDHRERPNVACRAGWVVKYGLWEIEDHPERPPF